MSDKKIHHGPKYFFSQKLRRQLLLGGFFSLAVAIGIMFLTYAVTNEILEKTVYGQYYENYMLDQQMNDLKNFINENVITKSDLSNIDEWCFEHNENIMVYLVCDDSVSYEWSVYGPRYSRRNNTEGLASESFEEIEQRFSDEKDSDWVKDEADITLSDGSEYMLYLYFHSNYGFYYLILVLSGVAAFFAFAITFILLVRNKLRYIVDLKRDLDILAGGDLQYQVKERGRDEINDLAIGINQMRESILAKESAEEQARQANAELVTAMSHDLRSPLTAMIGYLEILRLHKYESDEQRDYFVESSRKKALQIKNMSDKLFEYFLVSQSETEEKHLESYDLAMLILEMLEEYIFSLECEDFTVESELCELCGTVEADPDLLKRVFDNQYSNLKKYADPAEPIRVGGTQSDTELLIRITNKIRRDESLTERTNIGISTCEKIMTSHGGSFVHREDGAYFTAEIHLPVNTKNQ